MLRRLRSGKRSARSGYNDVNDQCSHQDEHFNNAAHKQLDNHPTYPASPSRRSAYSQNRTTPPSQSKPLRQDHYRNRSNRFANDHQSRQRQQQRNKTQPVFDASQQIIDLPDDVSRQNTSLTYESSVTGISNASKSPNADNSVSFSTIWEREEVDFEHPSGDAAVDPTPMQVAEARKSALDIALYDRVTNNVQRNGYQSNLPRQRSATSGRNSTTQQLINPESRRHDYDYRPSPPQHRKAMNSPKENDTIIKVRLPSSPEMEKNEGSPPPSFIASSAQTQNVNNGTTHLITRLLKKHQLQAERLKGTGKKLTMNTLQQTDVGPTTTANVRHYQKEAARKTKPDPASNSSAAISRLERPPDPPAEEWKRPIPVQKVSSTHTKNTSSSSKFWDEVENFPAMKGERELRQFFQQNLVHVSKEPVDLERPHRTDHVVQTAGPQRRSSEPTQDETDNFSNAFSLNLNVDKQGRFDDSDISALEMFDSATVYHQNAMTGEAQNYWKLKYDRLKEETRAALKDSKIVEEPEEVEEKPRDQRHRPNGPKELNRVFSGLTVDLDDEGENSPFCRDGLSQTMNMLMQKVNEYENVGAAQTERRIEDNVVHLVQDPCVEIAEQAIFPTETPQPPQRGERPRYEQNLTNNKSLADDLTAALSSRLDENQCHVIESEAAEVQCYMPSSTPNYEREKKTIPRRKHGNPDSRPTSKKEHSHRQEMNVITPDKSASSPDNKQLHSESTATDTVTPMLCLGSLHQEASTFERVRQSLLRCSDRVMSRYVSSSNSNQLAILNGIDPQKMIRQCHNPQSLGKTLSQTIVHYGKKVIQKREVISELNQNILRFGARHPLVGESHLKVGLLHMYDGHYPDSILHLEESIKIKTTFLEPNHPDLAAILMFIALNQLALERFDDCMSSLLGVKRFRQDAVGNTHPEIGLILNNIACVHYELGDSKRAESLFQEALDLQREAFTTEPTFLKSVSTLLSNIAFLHAKNGLFPKALIELEGALQIQQEILCNEDNESDAILENIAHIMAIQKMQHGSGNMEEITNQYMTMLMRR